MAILTALVRNPRYTLMRGPARFEWVRDAVAGSKRILGRSDACGHESELRSRFGRTLFPDVSPERCLAQLRETGCGFGLKLPQTVVNEIRKYADSHPVYAFRDTKLGFRPESRQEAEGILGKEILLAQYFNAERECPAVAMIASDPVLNWIALKYIGCVPKYLGPVMWWTYPVTPDRAEQMKHAHFFHRDIDDFRFLKFFFYLTDVDKGDGGHWVVTGSHRKAPYVRLWDRLKTRRYEDAEIREYYGERAMTEVCGSAGTGFAEDTLCVHKAQTPTRKPRLILHVQFGLFHLTPENDRRDPSELKMLG
jgi:hypothetical protein